MASKIRLVENHSVFTWTIERPDELIAQAAQSEETLHRSSPAVNGRWRLMFGLAGVSSSDTSYGVFLMSVDMKEPRYGVAFTIALYVDRIEKRSRVACATEKADVSPEKKGWGTISFVRKTALANLTAKNRLIFRVEIQEGEPDPPPPPPPPSIPYSFFNNPEYCDVVFEVPSSSTSSDPSYVFAAKPVLFKVQCFRTLLRSEFAEASATFELDPDATLKPPADTLAGDKDDFAAFAPAVEPPTPVVGAADVSSAPSAAEEGAAMADADAAPAQEQSRTLAGPSTQTAPERIRRARAKTYYRIKVIDSSYTTICAFIDYLYYRTIAFLTSMSHYLVAMSKVEVGGTLADPHAWLQKFPTEKRASFGPRCSPHALYRLADCYLHAELRDLAKKHILDGLTVENAAYELFSTLSRDYSDIQSGILTFILAVWEGVTSSRAWQHALELLDEGALPGGIAVVGKVLGMVAPKPATPASTGAGA